MKFLLARRLWCESCQEHGSVFASLNCFFFVRRDRNGFLAAGGKYAWPGREHDLCDNCSAFAESGCSGALLQNAESIYLFEALCIQYNIAAQCGLQAFISFMAITAQASANWSGLSGRGVGVKRVVGVAIKQGSVPRREVQGKVDPSCCRPGERAGGQAGGQGRGQKLSKAAEAQPPCAAGGGARRLQAAGRQQALQECGCLAPSAVRGRVTKKGHLGSPPEGPLPSLLLPCPSCICSHSATADTQLSETLVTEAECAISPVAEAAKLLVQRGTLFPSVISGEKVQYGSAGCSTDVFHFTHQKRGSLMWGLEARPVINLRARVGVNTRDATGAPAKTSRGLRRSGSSCSQGVNSPPPPTTNRRNELCGQIFLTDHQVTGKALGPASACSEFGAARRICRPIVVSHFPNRSNHGLIPHSPHSCHCKLVK